MQDIPTVAAITTEQKKNRFQALDVNKISDHFSSFSSGYRQILLWSDAELPRQAENDRMEQFRHKMNHISILSFT